MQKCNLCDSQVEIDLEPTLNWYRNAREWGCECGHCRNFLELARKRKLPARVMEVLDSLYIPPEKATYVCELYTDDAGIHYQFSYRIAGKILSGQLGGGNARCCHEPYPYSAPGFPEPHFDLEFYETLPWIVRGRRT